MRPFSVTMVPLSDFLMILGDIIIYEFAVVVSESFLFRIVKTYITFFQGVRKKPTTKHTNDKNKLKFHQRKIKDKIVENYYT